MYSALSLPYMGFRHQTQVPRLAWQAPYPLTTWLALECLLHSLSTWISFRSQLPSQGTQSSSIPITCSSQFHPLDSCSRGEQKEDSTLEVTGLCVFHVNRGHRFPLFLETLILIYFSPPVVGGLSSSRPFLLQLTPKGLSHGLGTQLPLGGWTA